MFLFLNKDFPVFFDINQSHFLIELTDNKPLNLL